MSALAGTQTPNLAMHRSGNSRLRRLLPPGDCGVRRLVAVLAVGGLPVCRPSWLIPSLQMRRKALSLSEGDAVAMR